jgi:hypothetical protein
LCDHGLFGDAVIGPIGNYVADVSAGRILQEMISCVGLPPLIAVSCVPPAIVRRRDEFGAGVVNNARQLVILVNGLIVYVVDPLMSRPLVGWLVAELSILRRSQSIILASPCVNLLG